MANASLAPIAGRLGKLVPMLSSDQPGEVVAAARAIGRALTPRQAATLTRIYVERGGVQG